MSLEITVLILLIIGLAFMALEAFVPAFGLLGIGGVASFVAAILMLRELNQFMGFEVDAPMLAALGVIGTIVLFACAYFVVIAWKSRAKTGAEAMVGMIGTVLHWENGRGQVHVDGEDWAAHGSHAINAGDIVKITARDRLILTVTKGE